VKTAFKETTAIRFEGNGYAPEWVTEAKKRGLLNLRRSPEALEQINEKSTKALFATLGILTPEELESRYHVRVERYLKDMLIEMHTMREMLDTMVLPAAYKYLGVLADASQKSKAAGIKLNPAAVAATAFARQVTDLQKRVAALHAAADKADTMHHTPTRCAQFLTGTGADAMAAAREVSDAIELMMGDEYWPLPRYREMVFPV
jgi:glutamine synthetase